MKGKIRYFVIKDETGKVVTSTDTSMPACSFNGPCGDCYWCYKARAMQSGYDIVETDEKGVEYVDLFNHQPRP